MEEMTANSLIMNAPQKPRRSSEHLSALRRQSLGKLDFEFQIENANVITSTNVELDEDQDFPLLFKPNFHQSPRERENQPLGFELEAPWEEEDEEEDFGKEEELSKNILLNAPRKGKHSAVARFALRKQMQEEALLGEDNFFRKRKFSSCLGEEAVEGEQEEVSEEEDFCRKRKFTLEEEEEEDDDDEEAKGETLELKTLPLKKRVRFNLSSLFRKNLEDFVNEKKMEELENGMKQL